jgi:hypothetical protein
MTPLYGHASQETAYLVPDYPYGRKVRCRIRYWMERDANRGYRFCSQTENPKTLRWNAPKRSTYALISGAMYLDERNHVQWRTVTEYTGHDEALAFVQAFPGLDKESSDRLVVWAAKKAAFARACASGKAQFTINAVVRPWTDEDNARHTVEAQTWLEVVRALRPGLADKIATE